MRLPLASKAGEVVKDVDVLNHGAPPWKEKDERSFVRERFVAEVWCRDQAPYGVGPRPAGGGSLVPYAVTLVELLAHLAGAELSFRREADLLGVSALSLPGGRQILIIERVYRDGTGILLAPPCHATARGLGPMKNVCRPGQHLRGLFPRAAVRPTLVG